MVEGGSDGPLTPEQHQELADAGERARVLGRARKIAAFNAWTIGGFAAITLVFGLTSPVAMILGIGMAIVARTEFRGLALLKRFDAGGPRLLAKNQLGFMALIVGYCCWSIYGTLYGPGPDLAGLDQILGDTGDLITDLIVIVYLSVIAATVVFQGLTARYYWTRARLVEEYLRDTPAWVVQMQRELG